MGELDFGSGAYRAEPLMRDFLDRKLGSILRRSHPSYECGGATCNGVPVEYETPTPAPTMRLVTDGCSAR